MSVPSAWATLLLALASYRLWRLLAADTILDKPRDWLTKRAKQHVSRGYRKELDIFLHCPWCLGWWICLAVWGAWQLWPHATLVVSVPLALSALVGAFNALVELLSNALD